MEIAHESARRHCKEVMTENTDGWWYGRGVFKKSDGSPLPVKLVSYPVTSNNGDVVGCICLAEIDPDLTPYPSLREEESYEPRRIPFGPKNSPFPWPQHSIALKMAMSRESMK